MKEPFVDTLTNQGQALLLGDIVTQAYFLGLSPGQSDAVTDANVASTMDKVSTGKNSQYLDTFDQITGTDNSITSTAYYLTRSRDLTNLATSVKDMTNRQLSASETNAGLSGRQTEINEWSNSNKLDTLYFLQVLFICLSLVGILCFLVTNGTIGQSMFTFLSYTIAILATVSILLRWRYTRVARDTRYWNKAKFPSQKTPIGEQPSGGCGATTPAPVFTNKRTNKVCTEEVVTI